MWRETWRIIWGTPSVLSVLGAVTAVALAFLAACLVLGAVSARLDRRRRDGCRVPLLLLRAWTWRKRRRNSKHPVIPDWAGEPLSGNERAALERLEKEIH